MTAASTAQSRVRLRTWVRSAALMVMLGFAGAAVVLNREALAAALRELAPWSVIVSFAPAVLAVLAALAVWRTMLGELGARLSRRAAGRVFFVSQLGKYVPGAVWAIAAQIDLNRDLGVAKRTSLAGAIWSTAVAITVGLPLAAVTLPLAAPELVGRFWPAFATVPLLLATLHPAVLGRLLNTGLRLARRPPLTTLPTLRGLLRAGGRQLVVWLLFGAHAWLLLVGAGAPPSRALPVAIGGYALAYSLGLLSLLPSGAGVREAALTLAFAIVIPVPAALVVALVSRAVLVVVDLTMASVAHLWRPPLGATTS